MNPGEFSVRNNRIVFVAMLLLLAGGFAAYQSMGRLEDPEFTIKEALIITPYPGASADEVAKEVTNPIESACPRLRTLTCVQQPRWILAATERLLPQLVGAGVSAV